MVVSFDAYGKYEQPQMILCNPGTVLKNGTPTLAYGELPLVSDVEITLNFNEMSEVCLRTYYIPDNQNGWIFDVNERVIALYNAVMKYRYIFIPDIGFFRIDETTDTTENGRRVKDVSAVSCEVELKSPLIPYIADGTYPLTGTDPNTGMPGVLDTVMLNAPLWTIGHVDSSIAGKNRSFENVDVSKDVYTFLTEDIQDAYECVVLFDILNRTVNVYSNNNIGTPTSIHLAKDDLVEVIKTTDSNDGPYTAFRIFGDEATSISAVNPLGGNTVYDFSGFTSWMSSTLASKVIQWQQYISEIEGDYYDLSVNYYDCIADMTNAQAEIDRLNIQLELYTKCRENIIATDSTVPAVESNEQLSVVGGTPITITSEVSDVIDDIDALIQDVEAAILEAQSEYDSLEHTA